MATRKTKQDISKEDMFNKIMPSLNQENNNDEEEAPKKTIRNKSTTDKKTTQSKTSASKTRTKKMDESEEDSKVSAPKTKTASRTTKKSNSAVKEVETDDSIDETPKKRGRNTTKPSDNSVEKTKKARTTRKKEADYTVINLNEELLNKRFDEIFQKFHCCHCNGCRFTVMAAALNELPAKYIAVKTNEKDSIIEISDDSHIRSSIIQAILKLMINPLH